ncbi:MAG TPA: 2-oxoacid:acceptor oxidoreductase family protein [Candidatus Binatia bacterium]|nr:2-oxoacid:acceptor oxidoreductase family protein [Candidatus Binatia bacterium]
MIEIRFHGRGGQGAKIASRILGQSGFLSGLYAQDFALFGAERRGAPVVSFTRLSTEPIDRRGEIERPNLVIVMDDSLLIEAAGQVFHGVEANTPIIVNADPQLYLGKIKELPVANYVFIDFDQIARKSTAHAVVSAPAAAAAAKCVPAISWDPLAQAVRREICEFGLAADLVEKNLDAARETYGLAPCLDLFAVGKVETVAEVSWPAVPYLGSSQFAGPTIRRRGSATLRATGNWRTERPEIELAKCKRCFLCYLYCPEAAMRLDAENFPHVDYDHCKGCMICYEECPTEAISRRMEA